MLSITARAAGFVLAVVFLWAAVAKVARGADWRDALNHYGLPRRLRIAASAGVPVTELVIAASLLLVSAKAGATLAVSFLAGASLAVLTTQGARGNNPPCGCFGGRKERDYRWILGRNAALGALAGIVLVSNLPGGLARGIGAPGGAQLLPFALVVIGSALAVWTAWLATTSMGRGHEQ